MIANSEVTKLRHASTIISIGADLSAFEIVNEAALDSYAKGGYDQAEKLFRQELNYRDALLGRCPATFSSMNNLAMSLSKLGKHEEACALYTDSLRGLESLLEKDHEDTLCVKCNLAASLYLLHQIPNAEKLYHQMQHLRKSTRFSTRLDKTYSKLESLRDNSFNPTMSKTKVLEAKPDASPTQEEHISGSKATESVHGDLIAGALVHTTTPTTGDLSGIRISTASPLPWKPKRESDLQPVPFDRSSQTQLLRRPSSTSNLLGSFSVKDRGRSISVKIRDAWSPFATILALPANEQSPRWRQSGYLRSSSASGFPRISSPLPMPPHYEFPRTPPPVPSAVSPLRHESAGSPPLAQHVTPPGTNVQSSPGPKHSPSAPTDASPSRDHSFKERAILARSNFGPRRSGFSRPSSPTSSPLRTSSDGEANEEGSPRQSGVVQLVDVSVNKVRGFSKVTIQSIATDRTLSGLSYGLGWTLDLEAFRADKINTYPVSALLDTGSDADFISETLRDLLDYDLEPEVYDGPNFTDASSHVFKPVGIVKVLFRWRNDGPENLMKRKFAVAPSLPPNMNMILGKGFINQYEVLQFNGKLLPIRLTPLSEKQIAEAREVSEKARVVNEAKEAQEIEQRRLGREKHREDARKRLNGV